MRWSIGLVTSLLTLAACSEEAPKLPVRIGSATEASVPDAALARGKAVAGELKKTLVGALTTALGKGAPAAIEVCHTEAPALAAALARDGVTVGRATRKPRNPSNAARGWHVDALAYFEALHARGGNALEGARFATRLPDGRIGYAEPLVIQPLCVTCHGAALAPEVQAALAARYPEDRATGYNVGDLRGVVWVELPN